VCQDLGFPWLPGWPSSHPRPMKVSQVTEFSAYLADVAAESFVAPYVFIVALGFGGVKKKARGNYNNIC